MERGHDPVKRGISWTGQSTTTHAATILDETETKSWDKEEHSWVKAKPLLISSSGDLVQKTNLGRSASLSEKELKEARTRSQIIATQLTVPSNCKSRGVQLFNRRRERVNAFTFTSVGGGEEGSHEEPCDELESPSPSTLTWNKECSTESRIKDFKHRRSETQLQWPTTVITSKGHKMEGAVEVANEVGDRVEERHFLPVIDNDKDEEIPEHEEAGKDVTFESDNSPVVPNPNQERQQDVQLTRAYESPLEALKAIQNGNHSTKTNSKVDNSATKQSTITNRTARPFFSPVEVTSTEAIHSPDIPLTPAYSTSPPPAQYDPTATTYSKQEPLTFVKPAFSVSSRQVFSPPPPAPSYPTPSLPSYMSLPPSIPSDPPPLSAMSPPPSPAYYTPLTIPSSTYANQLMADRRTVTPNRTGILEEGRGRRSNRKSMFTFQEKPKLSPNPELLSLVQTTDEKKKSRGQETHQEEEQLALGAEASNFLVKDESGVEEALVPEWASTLKSSRTQPRVEHKLEQALSSASGKGAELFAKRQSRMEKYVHENAEGLRSPSPTTSLPPSWVYPSNMPGRVKAIINASNITAEISKTFQAQQVTQKKNTPAKLPVPPPVQENPTLENGCTRVEMELSRHKPYQINSSLFILNPTKDPKSTLPRAAPPPKPVVMGSSYPRQTSLPSTPIPSQYDSHAYRSAHCFSPPMMPLNSVSRRVTSPMSDAAPERVTSPRSSMQAPKPTFSTKKAGITPQGKEDSLVVSHINSPSSPVPWTPNLFRRHSSTDKSPGAGWTPISQHSSLVTSPPPKTIHIPINSVASSPPAKTIHNSTTCSPISGSIHNPVTSSPTPRSIHNPISPPPNPRHFNSPVTSSTNTQSMSSSPSPKPYKSSVAIISLSKPTNIHTATTPVSPPWETRGQSPIPLQDTKANHRLIAKNIINAAKRKNSLSPRALSGHGLLMSPVSSTILPFETKPQSPFQSRALGAQSPTFTSPPATPTQLVRSPLRLYTSRSLTDSDASLESEDSGMRSPGVRSYNTCPRGWSGSLRLKRGAMSEDL